MNSIRRQLTRNLLLAILLLVGSGLWAVYFAARTALEFEFDRALLTKAQAISSLTWQNANRIVVAQWNRYVQGFDPVIATDFFQMWSKDGTVIERAESLEGQELPQHFGTVGKPEYFDHALENATPVRAVGYSFVPRQTNNFLNYGPIEVRLVVASRRNNLDRTLLILRVGLLSCGAVLMASMFLLVPRVLRHGLHPLNRLAQDTAAITAQSLGTRFQVDGMQQELRPIASQLNELLHRLEESFERERQFGSNLAHEMRTPLAEMRGLVELALKWPESRTAATDQELLDVLLHTEGIVTRLLELAHSEHGDLPVARESLQLQNIVASVWQPFAEKAASRRLDVACDIPPGMVIEADEPLFRNLVANLFDNATEYAPGGGKIEVRAGQKEGGFRLSVSNTVAPSFNPADIPKFFDRFWRKEQARTRGLHTGLGLSFVKAVACAHGWTVSVELEAPDRLKLQVEGSCAAGTGKTDSSSEPAANGSARTFA